jgi:hypothetical protein
MTIVSGRVTAAAVIFSDFAYDGDISAAVGNHLT